MLLPSCYAAGAAGTSGPSEGVPPLSPRHFSAPGGMMAEPDPVAPAGLEVGATKRLECRSVS
jgi:hypothetical protein